MNDADSKVLAAVQHEIRRLEHGRLHPRGEDQRRLLLGAFVDAALNSNGLTRADLAERMQMDVELVDAILDGLLPEDEVDDFILIDIAREISYEPNLLRVILGRAIVPAQNPQRTSS